MDQGAYGDGSHVHHGIQVLAVQDLVGVVDGVKGLSRGLYAHMGAHYVHSIIQQCLEKEDRLDDTLDSKKNTGVAFRLILSMTGENAEAQPVGIAFLQLRNIACHLAEIGIGTAAGQEFLQRRVHRENPPFFCRW